MTIAQISTAELPSASRRAFLSVSAGVAGALGGTLLAGSAMAQTNSPASAEALDPSVENTASAGDGSVLIRGADIVTMSEQGDLLNTDVLVEDGRIAEIGPSLESDADQVIDGRGIIVLPGFIDTHRHMWNLAERGFYSDATLQQYLGDARVRLRPSVTADAVGAATYHGRLEALDYGITTVFEYGTGAMSPAHAEASVDALARAPGRSIFSYAIGYQTDWGEGSSFAQIMDAIDRLRNDPRIAQNPELELAVSFTVGWTMTDEEIAEAVAYGREHGMLLSIHGGIASGGAPASEVLHLDRLGLLGPDIIYAHGNTFTDQELALLEEKGGSVSVSPETELLHGMGTPATLRLIEAGLRPSVAVDGAGMVSGDLFHQMRLALQTARGAQHAAAHAEGRLMEANTIRARDALGWITIDAAHALGMDDRIGSIEVGKDADLIILDASGPAMTPRAGDPATLAVMYAQPDMIRDVLVRGAFVKRDGNLVDVDMEVSSAAIEAAYKSQFEAKAFTDNAGYEGWQ